MGDTDEQRAVRGNRVFISYRRDGGFEMARLVRDPLQLRGYSVCMDEEDLRRGPPNTALLRGSEVSTDLVVVLSSVSLDRCRNKGDWLRREVVHALNTGWNVAPIMMRGFQWPTESLPDDIVDFPNYHGIALSQEFLQASMDGLVKLLKSVPIREGKKRLKRGVL